MTITKERAPSVDKISLKAVNLPNNSIPHDKEDLSTYSKVLALYTRDPVTTKLYCIEEKQDCEFEDQWDSIMQIRKQSPMKKGDTIPEVLETVVSTQIANLYTNDLGLPIKISEIYNKEEKQIRGCISTVENKNNFNDWFIFHIMDQARLRYNNIPKRENEQPYHEIFADYFEKNMKNTIVDDQWNNGGRDYFIKRVKYFTDRQVRIECVLPAFPCKSSNVDKVCGNVPDKGEELALKRLIKATQEVAEIYPPGMKVWIISDGHVFSDCIGVDDDVVNSYTKKLHQLYEKVAVPGMDAIGFCGLNDIFFKCASNKYFDPAWVDDMVLEHYTGSKICAISELSRKTLMKGCDTDDGRLKKHINIDGHPRLYLYRGFSRFMSEDLALLPHFKHCSKKKFKKTVSKIAFNMIKRNDAYSNLVELVFPHHLRLSIHAHTNSGPKYGIKVISPEQCRIVKSLEDIAEPTFEDLLHIPTPWHNCVVKFGKNEKTQYFLTKSKAVKDALETGIYQGAWKETCFDKGEGGHFTIAYAAKEY